MEWFGGGCGKRSRYAWLTSLCTRWSLQEPDPPYSPQARSDGHFQPEHAAAHNPGKTPGDTSDGEYINCTGLIPDGQYSMRKSADNNMAYTLPRFFAEEGVSSFAYHNNSLTYYDRYLTHPNLGYDFKACRLGELSEEEWGDKIFPMEHPNAWPASDLEMMQGNQACTVDVLPVAGACLPQGHIVILKHKTTVT